LSDLNKTLEKTREFASKNAKRTQEQYAKFYNTKAVHKSFDVGEQVIVLERDSNSKTFSRWQTGEICRKLSPYTYIVSMPNGSMRHLFIYFTDSSAKLSNSCSKGYTTR